MFSGRLLFSFFGRAFCEGLRGTSQAPAGHWEYWRCAGEILGALTRYWGYWRDAGGTGRIRYTVHTPVVKIMLALRLPVTAAGGGGMLYDCGGSVIEGLQRDG